MGIVFNRRCSGLLSLFFVVSLILEIVFFIVLVGVTNFFLKSLRIISWGVRFSSSCHWSTNKKRLEIIYSSREINRVKKDTIVYFFNSSCTIFSLRNLRRKFLGFSIFKKTMPFYFELTAENEVRYITIWV